MKKATLFLVYAAAAVIGLLLLIFNRTPYEEAVPGAIRGLVIAGGIVFIIGGILSLYNSMRPKVDALGVAQTRPWYGTVLGIAGIFWGILMLVTSTIFAYNLAITLGVSLIIAGFAQGMWIVNASRPYGAAGWWYVIPFATICAGIVDMVIINDYTYLSQSSSTAAIVSGILLILFGVNGFISLNRRKRVEKQVIDSVNEIARENKKVS